MPKFPSDMPPGGRGFRTALRLGAMSGTEINQSGLEVAVEDPVLGEVESMRSILEEAMLSRMGLLMMAIFWSCVFLTADHVHSNQKRIPAFRACIVRPEDRLLFQVRFVSLPLKSVQGTTMVRSSTP